MTERAGMTLSPRQANWLIAIFIAMAGLLAYANTFSGAFVWDDASSILLHKTVQHPSQFFQLFQEDQHAYGRGQGNFYRPLVAASFMLDFAIAYHGPRPVEGIPEVSPFLFHVTSTLWHIGASILLFVLMTRLGAPLLVRAAVPFVYVIHPLHTEAVAYISGRADSMSAAFMFAGLCFVTWDETARHRAIGTLGAAVCFGGALLSKESAMIFPVLAVLVLHARAGMETASSRPSMVQRAVSVAAATVVLGIYGLVRLTLLQFESDSVARAVSLGERLVEVFQAFAIYLGLLFVPTGLHMERTLDHVPAAAAIAGAGLFVLCVGFLAWTIARDERRAALGMAWFLVTWLPISGIFPLNAPMAEHWMYVPMAGFFWALAEVSLPRLTAPAPLRAATAAVFIWSVLLLGATVHRNQDWQSDEALFTATLAKNPNSLRVRYNLAVVYEDLIDNPIGAEREFTKFIQAYEAMEEHAPKHATFYLETALESYLSLANLQLSQGNLPRAAEHLQKVLTQALTPETRPYIGEAAFFMGRLQLTVGNRERAVEFFQNAIQLRPDFEPLVQQLLSGRAPSQSI